MLEKNGDCTKYAVEQAITEETRHNEWGQYSDSWSIRFWEIVSKNKYSPNASISSAYLVHQFASSHPRREHEKHFTYRLLVVKKTQRKTKNDNPSMHDASYNAKNEQKVLVKLFDSNHTIMLSY